MRLWLTLYCAFAFAQSPVTSTAPAAKQPRLAGRVLSTTGEPVRKANVRLEATSSQDGQASSAYAESSDNDGKFLFDAIPPGRYTLIAEKSGFVTGRYGARTPTGSATPINVVSDQEVKDLVLVLTPNGVLSGSVLDQDGDPMPSAQIMLLHLAYNHGRRRLLAAGGKHTDDQGNFRFANLVPGRYYLTAQDSREDNLGTSVRPGREGAKAESYLITYYPSVNDITSASPIDVSAGAEVSGLAVQLRKGRVFTIRGRAVNASTGAPAADLPVMALPKDTNEAPVVMMISRSLQQARPDGSFEIGNLSPGTYVLQNLTAHSTDGHSAAVTGRLELNIADADVDGVTFALGPGAEIAGTIRLEGGDVKALLSSQQKNGSAAAAGPNVELIPEEETQVEPLKVPVKADGTFRISGVPAARFVVNVGGIPESAYVKAVRFGGVDVSKEALDLTSGKGGTLEVVLSMGAADATGTLLDSDGRPLANIPVTLWPKDLTATSSWLRVRTTVTDQVGSFKFNALGPGDYYSAAWEDADPGVLENSDFLARFTNSAVSLSLAEKSHETLSLKLISRDKIAIEMSKIQ